MSTTTDKVKELGITKGEAKLIEHTRRCPATDEYEYYGAIEVDGSRQMSFDEGCEEGLPDTMLDAYLTIQKSGFLPSELWEQRDEAMKLASDAVDLIKVLANQIHSLPQNAVSALTHRTFSEMFDLRDGAAYGQARAIVDRLTRIKQGNP